MTPPADLAALRALVERAGVVSVYCSCYGCKAITPLVLPARLALERVEERDRVQREVLQMKTTAINDLSASRARLEEALRRFGVHRRDCHASLPGRAYHNHLVDAVGGEKVSVACDCGLDAALEGK